MPTIEPAGPAMVDTLRAFLARADLTVSGLDAPGIRLWLLMDGTTVVGSTGFERSGEHALIRSVAVDDTLRGQGHGERLARYALEKAAAEGARRAWLFSRRSGRFWQRLGFEPADRARLASVLSDTYQVRLFARTGQLDREVAWSRGLEIG